MSIGLMRLERFEAIADDGLAGWLAEHDVCLAFGRADQLVTIGRAVGGELRVDAVDVGAITALTADGRSLWLATDHQLWCFADGLASGEVTDGGNDAVLLPFSAAVTGGTGVVDLGVLADGSPVMASGRFSCLATLADGYSFRPVWMARWVSRLVSDERSPVSGVAMRDGAPAAVTLLGCHDEPGAWRTDRATGGAIVDLVTDEVVVNGLAVPSTPRWHDGRLWFTQSGTGELCVVEPDDTVTAVVALPTFLRGLALVGPYAVVAGSGSRFDSLVDGLPVGERLAGEGRRPEQGLWVVDTRTGEVVHRLRIEGTGRETMGLTALHGVRRPSVVAPSDAELQTLVSFDQDWDPDTGRVERVTGIEPA